MSKYLNSSINIQIDQEENKPDWFKDHENAGIDPYSKKPYSVDLIAGKRLTMALEKIFKEEKLKQGVKHGK